MINDDMARIYREMVGRAGVDGISRLDAIDEAAASILTEINTGRIKLDIEGAVRAHLHDIDKRDGKSADRIVRAAARGDLPLDDTDLDLVVTLGGGLRKQWDFITAGDMQRMDDLRFQNLEKAQTAYATWRASYSAILPVLFQFGSFGDAFHAGAFHTTRSAA